MSGAKGPLSLVLVHMLASYLQQRCCQNRCRGAAAKGVSKLRRQLTMMRVGEVGRHQPACPAMLARGSGRAYLPVSSAPDYKKQFCGLAATSCWAAELPVEA